MMTKVKQKALVKKILNNPSKDEVTSEDMVEVGYSPNTRPHEVVESDAWQKLIEKYLPDEKLATAHSDALDAMKIHGTNDNFIEIADHPTRIKAVELGYKLKGKLAPTTLVQVNVKPILGELKAE